MGGGEERLGARLLKNCCFLQFSLVDNNFRVITNMEGLGVLSSVTINFGEAFRKRNIYAKMIFVKQKKPTKAASK